MISTSNDFEFEKLSADNGGEFSGTSLPGKGTELPISSSEEPALDGGASCANPPGTVPFINLGSDWSYYGGATEDQVLDDARDDIDRVYRSSVNNPPLNIKPVGYTDPMPRPQWFEHLAPAVAREYWYICAAHNVRELVRGMSTILEQDLQLPGLLETWADAYDGFTHYGYSVTCRSGFQLTASEGRDALIDLEAYVKLYYDDRFLPSDIMRLYSLTKNRVEYDKVCAAIDFRIEFDKEGGLSPDFRDKSENYKGSFILPQEEFLAGFKARLNRAVDSLSTCPMMKRGDSKEALPQIIACVKELYEKASSLS